MVQRDGETFDMSEDHKKFVRGKQNSVWGKLLGAKGQGPDYKITESMYIERWFFNVNKEGVEERMRKEWREVFVAMDVNQDGFISKTEHRWFFEARLILMEPLSHFQEWIKTWMERSPVMSMLMLLRNFF